MDKVRLLRSGIQDLVPTEAALSSFTMNRSPIVLENQSTPDYLLSCMELEKRNLFESPALVRDFLWASGLLDLVQLRTRTSGIRNNNNKAS
ncbi:hypothetical protein AVEN_78089-1 [Araneus ventricosus]|uniref:Uncharacterized protein n=1 Tax=Araneus ventricosus TaxID=182803 RepID=A0A4Y2F364_ARAVE|nr:hypothetical protein AVEN_78089-1 [Araneus ventricosus]